jgi:hypothetical protein
MGGINVKKAILYTLAVIGMLLGIAGFIAAGVAIQERNRADSFDKAPTFEQVEEDLEYWLISDSVYVDRKEKIENYIVYYALIYRGQRSEYYAAVYKMESGSLMSYYWQYSHSVEIDYRTYEGD